MKKSYPSSLKTLGLLFGLLLGLSLGTSAQSLIHVELWRNAAGTGGSVNNYPVWIKLGAPLNYTMSGTTDNTGRYMDSIPNITVPTQATFITYSCTGARIVSQITLSPNNNWYGDTLVVACSTPKPVLHAFANATQSTINPLLFSFLGGYSDSAMPSGRSYTYSWNFGDGQSATGSLNTTHTYANAGTYVACLTVTVSDTLHNLTLFSKTSCVTVVAGSASNCQADFRFSTAGSGAFSFMDSSMVGTTPVGGSVSYGWDFGNGFGANTQSATHTYSAAGTYNVCHWVVVRNALSNIICTDTICKNVVVTAGPAPVTCRADIFHYQDSILANTVNFFNNSQIASGGQAYSINVFWTFGDGDSSTAIDPTHTYLATGTYIVCMNLNVFVQNQLVCSSSTCDTVVVGSSSSPFCNAQYIVDTANSYQGNVFIWNTSTPSNTSAIHANSYQWDFGDGNTSNQPFPVHTYANPGMYAVCLSLTSVDSANNFCTDTYCDTLGVDSLGNLIYKTTGGFTLNVLDPGAIGLNEIVVDEFAVYPNPANDIVTVAWNKAVSGEMKWQITDLKGALLMRGAEDASNKKEMQLDVSRLKAGVYILSASHKNNPVAHYKLRIN